MALLSRVLLFDRGRPSKQSQAGSVAGSLAPAATVAAFKRVFGQAVRSSSHTARGPVGSSDSLRAVLDAMFDLRAKLPDDLGQKLSHYFSSPANLAQLLNEFLTKSQRSATSPGDARTVYKYAYVSSAYVTYGPPRVRECLSASPECFKLLLDYLVQPPSQSDPIITDMVAKIVCAVLADKPAQVTRMLSETPGVIQSLVGHSDGPAVSSLLARMVSEQEFGRSHALAFGSPHKRTVVELAHVDVLRLLAERFATATEAPTSSNTLCTLESSAKTFFDISTRASMATRREEVKDENIEVYYGIAPSLFNRSLDALDATLRPANILTMMDAALAAYDRSAAHPGLAIVCERATTMLRLFRRGRNIADFVIAKRVSNISFERLVSAFLGRAEHLARIGTASGGMLRTKLSCLGLLAEFLHLDNSFVDITTALDFPARLMNMAMEHWNCSMLHATVKEVFSIVLDAHRSTEVRGQWMKALEDASERASKRGETSSLYNCVNPICAGMGEDRETTAPPKPLGGSKPRVFSNRISSEVYVGDDVAERVYIELYVRENQENAMDAKEHYPLWSSHRNEHGLARKKKPTLRARRSLPEDYKEPESSL